MFLKKGIINMEEKYNLWTSPLPELIALPFRKFVDLLEKAFFGKHKEKQGHMSNRAYNIACVSIFVIFMLILSALSGFPDPLSFFEDIPVFSFDEFQNSLSVSEFSEKLNEYFGDITWYVTALYLILSLAFNLIISDLLNRFVLRKNEYPLFSIQTFLSFLAFTAVASVMDILSQKVSIWFFYEFLPEISVSWSGEITFIFFSLILIFMMYFVMIDFFSIGLSMYLTTYVIRWVEPIFEKMPYLLFLEMIVITFVLRLLITLVQKTGIIDLIAKWYIKWTCVPKYCVGVYLWIFFFPIMLVITVYKIIKKRTQPVPTVQYMTDDNGQIIKYYPKQNKKARQNQYQVYNHNQYQNLNQNQSQNQSQNQNQSQSQQRNQVQFQNVNDLQNQIQDVFGDQSQFFDDFFNQFNNKK